MAQDFLTLEGPDDGLGKFKFKRAFKSISRPIAKVVKTVTRPVFKVVKKTARYAGAGVFGTFMPAKARKKAFGLTDSESKKFEKGAKVTRGVAGALGAAALVVYGGPAAAKLMGSSFSKASGMLGRLGKQAGGVLMKNKDGIFKLMKDKAGEMVLSKFNSSQAPEELQDLPDDTPVPIEGDISMEQSYDVAPFVAGSGSLEPGGEAGTPRRFGDSRPYDYSGVISSAERDNAMDVSSVNPGGYSDPGDYRKLSPFQEALIRAQEFDTKGFRELMAESRLAKASGSSESLDADLDGSVSLQGIIKRARKKMKKTKFKGVIRRLKPSKAVKRGFTKYGRTAVRTGTSMLMKKYGGAAGASGGGAGGMMKSFMSQSNGAGGAGDMMKSFMSQSGGKNLPSATGFGTRGFNPSDIPDTLDYSLKGIIRRAQSY